MHVLYCCLFERAYSFCPTDELIVEISSESHDSVLERLRKCRGEDKLDFQKPPHDTGKEILKNHNNGRRSVEI